MFLKIRRKSYNSDSIKEYSIEDNNLILLFIDGSSSIIYDIDEDIINTLKKLENEN